MFLNISSPQTTSQSHQSSSLSLVLQSKFSQKMEPFVSYFDDQEWESLSKMFSGDQDSDQFPFHGLFSCDQDHHGLNYETPSIVSSVLTEANNDHGLCNASENTNPNFQHYFSQETNNGCAAHDVADSFPYLSSNMIHLPTNGVRDHRLANLFTETNNNSSLLDQVFYDNSMEEILCLRQDDDIEKSVDHRSDPTANMPKHTPAKRKIEIPISSPSSMKDKDDDEILDKINPKKKTRVSRDNKNKKKVQPKKKQKVMTDIVNNESGIEGEDTNKGDYGNVPIMSSSSCSSEDELNPCQDSNGGTVNSNWKTRAGRGAATDPQSLYARKRRERINERLKILQNLVPNGTKVDISTMLEEAVQYVKFLQLQMKLLSSDDMWMYAPIAYNGMDIGLHQKLSLSQS